MSGDILITDNRLAFTLSLADYLRVQGLHVCLTADESRIAEKKKERTIEPFVVWNRTSFFSLQSIPLQLKNLNMDIETAVVVFDAPAYSRLYGQADIMSADTIFSELITANMQLTYILLSHFIHRKTGHLIFVHKDIPFSCGNAPLAAASGAFMRMAEETVMLLTQEEHSLIQKLLVRIDGDDTQLYAEWLASQIQQPVVARTPGRWVKAGQRSLFGK